MSSRNFEIIFIKITRVNRRLNYCPALPKTTSLKNMPRNMWRIIINPTAICITAICIYIYRYIQYIICTVKSRSSASLAPHWRNGGSNDGVSLHLYRGYFPSHGGNRQERQKTSPPLRRENDPRDNHAVASRVHGTPDFPLLPSDSPTSLVNISGQCRCQVLPLRHTSRFSRHLLGQFMRAGDGK